jgi:hypothetical protein
MFSNDGEYAKGELLVTKSVESIAQNCMSAR